jgi:protein-L-isoaspartate(D-aspartate) O-methyltransferase
MEPFDSLYLWLATALDGFCLLSVDPTLDTGLASPQNSRACPAVVEGGSFAYLAVRHLDENLSEFGAHGYGQQGAALAAALADQIRVWDRDHRSGPGPRIAVYPAGTSDERLPSGRVIDKRHARVTVSWPTPDLPAPDQVVPHHPHEKE